jgi:hypothetical protein
VRYLTEMGVRVTVLTADETTIPKRFKYDHDLLKKIPSEVRIHRVPAFEGVKRLFEWKSKVASKPAPVKAPAASAVPASPPKATGTSQKGVVQKLKDAITLNLHTPDNYAFWIWPAVRAGAKIIRAEGIDNILSSSPPGSAHVVAYHLQRRTGAHWVADFRDPWARKQWHNPQMTDFKRNMNERLERKILVRNGVVQEVGRL